MTKNNTIIGLSSSQVINQHVEISKVLSRQLNTTYRFWFVRYDGKQPTNTASFDTELSITIEFVKIL